ncbi:2-aminoethylphosphonate--pyruvate transaminase [Enterococcus lemanii]|uniref:2-aminoethylphosphonate--pyruvate transaminase n=1 Tax=Enterococcus lemanii TaxID=1159752 RepID=A0ABV9MT40_9ENTE|nr:2-aminoethylphosphonate--pyruvate transaminase [Enterococcus lemanii]MBM7709086.1 2-aminoethylphosphonate-pyruvate transaminase [Enterococcus lemanii]
MTYKLLTPGPLTTSVTVKAAMQEDHCTWDEGYKTITQWIRSQLLELAEVSAEEYTAVLMQGSGTFGVESVISSVLRPDETLLICVNGAYGQRLAQMAARHQIPTVVYEVREDQVFDSKVVEELLKKHPAIRALAVVHSETTSGILNPLTELSQICQAHQLTFIVDAMSSFGGIAIPVAQLGIHYLISSANKCIQGVPGFSFAICQKEHLEKTQGLARTLSLDLYDQYAVMEADGGKWRYTSPTHTVLAFAQALKELAAEGGIQARYTRYARNNQILRQKMQELGFETHVKTHQGPFITAFYYPTDHQFSFPSFYAYLKTAGYAIYPGKISDVNCFRVGNIGEIYEEDMLNLTQAIQQYLIRGINE